jgi:molybdopterin molybdotransferase
MMSLLPVEEAQARLLDGMMAITATETVGLMAADGRVLAKPVTARLTQPPFDASAMDGYALRGTDVATPGCRLAIIGQSAAGRGFAGDVGPGECVRIFTGAPMPAGADTVLLQEDAERLADAAIINRFSPETGRHVRRRGQDFADGEAVLLPGMVLDPARLLVAAGMNHPELTVLRRPRVAIIATGDELVRPGVTPGPHQIVASSTFGVAALARAAGAEIIDLGIVVDDRDAIATRIDDARKAGVDILVTLGGASVGDFDLVQSTLTGLGMELDFWRIAMRPGKPLMVGSLDGMRVLGLPGNPVSTMVCALLFLEPLIARMAGLKPMSRAGKAVSALPLGGNDHRQDYLRARAERRDDGMLVAHSFGKQDSSQMKIFSQADCLIIRPPQAEPLAAGELCDIIRLREI